MARKKPDDHVFMGPEPYFATCERCGKHVAKPELPMPLDAFVAFCDYAQKLHADCPARTELPFA